MAENKTPRILTLKRKSEFSRIKSKGKVIRPCSWMFVSVLETQEGRTRFGWTIPSYCGKAHLRNRLRRWFREYFSQWDQTELQVDINVVCKRMPREFYDELKYKRAQVDLKNFERLVRKTYQK